MRSTFSFKVTHTAGAARCGQLQLASGVTLPTPIFMPVATLGAFRGIPTADVAARGFPILLANTFHLFLRFGVERMRQLGGLHKIMNWSRGLLTDSGGFQVFSLSHQMALQEEGVRIRSFIDGKWHLLTPELSMQMQQAIGSDIHMVLDQCVASTSDQATVRDAMHRSLRWAQRSFNAHADHPAALFGIVQGALDEQLRIESAQATSAIPFDGLAIGGLAVGEEKADRERIAAVTVRHLPPEKPRYMMGVGMPIDILEAVHCGVDMFDCILPVSLGQHGVVFTSQGKMDIRRGVYKDDQRPIDAACRCPACTTYSRAFINHLVKARETIGQALCGVHNLYFYAHLMEQIQQAISAGTFATFYREQQQALVRTDTDELRRPPVATKPRPLSLGNFEIVEREGVSYIADVKSAERMHPVAEPMVEARTLYVDRSGLMRRLQEAQPGDQLCIWDVGLGAGYNAIAVLEAVRDTHAAVTIVSFENDLDALRLVIKYSERFKHVWHPAPSALLKRGSWEGATSTGAKLSWQLLEGDMRERFAHAPAPDVVLFDPFSKNTNPEAWTVEVFSAIYRQLKPAGVLVTYSRSRQVRDLLAQAAFKVQVLPGVPPKEEHTLAQKLVVA